MTQGRWSYGVVGLKHPCILQWEWMQPTTGQKGFTQRCEAVFDRKNAVGLVAHVPEDATSRHLKRVASFAVASTVGGTEFGSKTFPTNVTTLAPGLVSFVLAGSKLKVNSAGYRNIAFLTNGSFMILHRSIALPPGSVDKSRWTHIQRLRIALHAELVIPEPKPDGGAPWEAAPPALLGNSEVRNAAWDLFVCVPHEDGATQAYVDEKYDGCPSEAQRWTVELDGPDN